MMTMSEETGNKNDKRGVSDAELALCFSSSLWNDPVLGETRCKSFF